jgi:hypothetical protein
MALYSFYNKKSITINLQLAYKKNYSTHFAIGKKNTGEGHKYSTGKWFICVYIYCERFCSSLLLSLTLKNNAKVSLTNKN